MKIKCELCKLPATTFCESDQASLCWNCDSNVHSANFLVQRHSRNLLCYTCQSPTQWNASGAKLRNAVSLCDRCAGGTKIDDEQEEESEGDNEDDIDTDSDEDNGDGDNQVVPWSSTATPPPASSSTTSDESVTNCNDEEVVSQLVTTTSLKRRREDHDFQVRI